MVAAWHGLRLRPVGTAYLLGHVHRPGDSDRVVRASVPHRRARARREPPGRSAPPRAHTPEIPTELVDPFMFSDRQSALERSRDAFERVALPADAALRAEVLGAHAHGQTVPEEPLLLQVKLEQEAFRRLLDMEDARIERERTLPTGAADLVRAIDEGWPTSPRPGALHDLESLLAWRFSNVDEALLPDTLSQAQRDDLEGALAALAPRVASLPKAAAAMVKLRASLEAMWAPPYALEDEHTMDASLSLYVGSTLWFDALDEALEGAATAFEAQASAGLSVLDPKAADATRARAKRTLLASPPCSPRVPVRSSLDMAPPPERAWACSLLHALDDAQTDEAELAADLAWHDAVVVARWAVSTHGPSAARTPRFGAPICSCPCPTRTRRASCCSRARSP